MPKRWCQCSGCPACGEHPGSHGQLYNADDTHTLRCPPCQARATAKRNKRTSSARRGYGARHRQARAEYLARWKPGDLCAHCGQPMWTSDGLDLAHTEDRTGYRGLAHAQCNRGNR